MIWDDRAEFAWKRGLEHAKAYFEEQGNLLVPAKYKAKDDFALGHWILTKRKDRSNGRMTEEEIHHYFKDDIHRLASAQGLTYEETCDRLKESYDGYHFAENSEGIYNPFSVLNTFDKMKFGSYWFETGTPTYLVELLKQNHYNRRRVVSWTTDANGLNDMDDNLISALY